jgi:formylmethanofuran dehydrogenase subunit E
MDIQPYLERSSARHSHLCPRQVLGVRIGLLAARNFGTPPGENTGKRLLAILESDGCFSDGSEVANGCTLGHRRLRLEDHGKIAATFVDTETSRAVRIAPRPGVRQHAADCLPHESRRYYVQLHAYHVLPEDELLVVQEIALVIPAARVTCTLCGEEVINERELIPVGQILCRSCAGEGYYRIVRQKAVMEAK